jgi:hypothetical protein
MFSNKVFRKVLMWVIYVNDCEYNDYLANTRSGNK